MSIDLPGFADPVLGAQAAFRAILDAMSRPGTIRDLGTRLTPPAPLDPATAAVLLALVDADTALHLDAACASARDWIAFHCGAPFAQTPAQADFVLALTLPDLAALASGTDDAPQEGATAIVQVASLDSGARFTVAGPGLRVPATIAIDGLPAGFAALWAENHARFPRGVDVVLCAGSRLMALPRSLRIMGEG